MQISFKKRLLVGRLQQIIQLDETIFLSYFLGLSQPRVEDHDLAYEDDVLPLCESE
jgi:hypothetical protein